MLISISLCLSNLYITNAFVFFVFFYLYCSSDYLVLKPCLSFIRTFPTCFPPSFLFQSCIFDFPSLFSSSRQARKSEPTGGHEKSKKSICPVLFHIKFLKMLFLSILHEIKCFPLNRKIKDELHKGENNSLMAGYSN